MSGLELPFVSFLFLCLLLLPLPWHWRSCNVPVVALTGWLVTMNLFQGVNTIVWHNNYEVRYELWCDIGSKVHIGVSIAIPAISVCVSRRLNAVVSSGHPATVAFDGRKYVKFDALMSLGLPFLVMMLHYIVQGHRFDIIENYGCYPTSFPCWQSVVLLWVLPIFLTATSSVYAALAFRLFVRQRLHLGITSHNQVLHFTTGYNLRLLGMAFATVAWGLPLTCYMLFRNAHNHQLYPYTSWKEVHYNFWHVRQAPLVALPPPLVTAINLTWCITPIASFILFVLFGFGKEAEQEYRKSIMWIRRHICRQAATDSAPGNSRGTHLRRCERQPQLNIEVPAFDPSALSPSWKDATVQSV